MPSTTYTYSIANDFPNGQVSPGNLDNEIRTSSIVTALDSISINQAFPDVITITFKDALSAGDKTILDGAGGLIASHDHVVIPKPHEVEIKGASASNGNLGVSPMPSSPNTRMCDRDAIVRTGVMTNTHEDLKVNTATMQRENWNELVFMGCFKGDDVSGYAPCTDQADADANAVLSVWNYQAHDGTNPIRYEIRGGSLWVDSNLVEPVEAHQIYVIVAPDIPLAMGGNVKFFDGYLYQFSGYRMEAENSTASVLDPTLSTYASMLRVYIFYPPGAKQSHVLRLITYRPVGA